ncbi:MAG: sugar phosphate isomerase/epimerase family protein [Candidatus Bathyarchaeia archaeon]
MKLSLSNGIFSKLSLNENLSAVKRLGFEYVEFNMKSVEKQTDDSTEPAKNGLAAHGLRCLTVHAASLHVKQASEVPTAIYYGQVSAEFAKALSAPVMVVHSNISRNLRENLRRRFLKEVFGEVKPYAEGLGVKLALENLSYASSGYGKNTPQMEEILRVIDAEGSMGVTLDFCHAEATGATSSLLGRFHERLCNVHMSNRAHKPFAEETAKLKAFLNALQRHEYDGPVTLELNRKCTLDEVQTTKTVLERALAKVSA